MQKEEITQYSQSLDKEMHLMVYGHGGIPFLCFPTQDSLCHNYEDFGMTDQLADYIDGGRIQQVQLLVRTRHDVRVALFCERAAYGAPHHAAVAGDIDLVGYFHFSFSSFSANLRSESIIILTRPLNVTFGSQPRTRFAFEGSPSSCSTSLGRS